MRITNVEIIQLQVPFTDGGSGEGLFPQRFTALDFVLIKIDTDAGITGWGEAFSFSIASSVATLLRDSIVPLIIGTDPTHPDRITRDLQQKMHLMGRYGITLFAISGVEIALWDITAKASGVSLAEHLGGRTRDRVHAYASLVRYADETIIKDTCSRALSEGYRCIKLHEIDITHVHTARATIGPDIPLVNDVNCNWDFNDTLAMADQLQALDLLWLEEPIFPPEDFKRLAQLRDAGLRIACGENACTSHQFAHMLEARAVDYIQPSVTKVGGITETRKARERANAAGVKTAQHSPYFGPGYLATLQMLANAEHDEWFEILYIDREADLYMDFPVPVNGVVDIPTGPGLGLDPDPATLARYRVS